MKISITKSGGFAGFDHEPVTSVSTDEMENSLMEAVMQLLDEIGFYDLPDFVAGAEFGADYFVYEILLSDGEKERKIQFVDDATDQTSALKKFVEKIEAIGAGESENQDPSSE
jgi:hypothetical protein